MRRARFVLACCLVLGLVPAGATPALGSDQNLTTAAEPSAALSPPSPAVPRPDTSRPGSPRRVPVHRVAELTDQRSKSVRRFRMSDGSIEAELSAAAQDTMIYEGAPTTSYGGSWNLNVGNTAAGTNAFRSLLRFDLSQLGIAPNTPIKAASLDVHFSQPHTDESGDVALEARKMTADWSESTATWASVNTAYAAGSLPFNAVQADDETVGRVQSTGPWQYLDGAANSLNGGLHQLLVGSTADTFTWNADIPTTATYRVDAHYTAAANRGVPSYAVTDATGAAKTYTVNQASGTAGTGVWAPLGSQNFAPGKPASVTMKRVTANSAPVADALRFVQTGTQTKLAKQRDAWHSYAVGNLVQEWVDNPAANFGVMLKAVNEDAGSGGPAYESREDVFGGETANRPRLVIRYAKPSVDFPAPTTVHPTGAELSWGDYVDPSPADGDDLVEFAIYRGCVTGASCPTPAPEHFDPRAAAPIGTVARDARTFTDTSATASTATEKASFRYWVVARTKDGTLAPSVAQLVQTPRPGRVARVLTGDVSDSTIAAATAQQGVNLPAPEGYDWLMVGNHHPTYGDTRSVLRFDTGSIPAGAKVLGAELQLWRSSAPGSGATFDVHELTRGFAESEVTWKNATSALTWTAAGGDYKAAAVASMTTGRTPGRLTWKGSGLTGAVQGWADKVSTNHGLLIKTRDEASTTQHRATFASGESSEPALRPRLVVEHLSETAADTYYAPEVPDRAVPGTTLTVPVTVTNTTNADWSGQRLSYRWMLGGADVVAEGNRLYAAVRDLAPGESQTLTMQIRVPVTGQTGFQRQGYDLELDLRNAQNVWASEPASGIDIDPLRRAVVVEDPTSSQLGLEKFFTYSGEDTGAGSTVTPNLHAGNAVFTYSPIQNPSRGASTFVRLTYDSNDSTASAAGRGWSVQASTLNRLGRSALSFSTDGVSGYPRQVTLVDGDGTSHLYTLKNSDPDPAKWTYERPAGVPLELRLDPGAAVDRRWVLTRPDGTRFFFEDSGAAGGIQRAIVDRNGNTTQFKYDALAGDERLLTSIVDASDRTTLTLTYEPGTSRLHRLADISGRTLRFVYNGTDLVELRDGGGYDPGTDSYAAQVKTFKFAYTDQRLTSIRDPRNAETKLAYSTGRLTTLTDRRGKVTEFGREGARTTVTDVVAGARYDTVYTTDGYGRTTSLTDANTATTTLSWDRDNNVVRMEEDNGAVSTWTYDPVTGYPTSARDAEANKNDTAAATMTYQKLTGAPGTPTVLTEKKSPEGRKWQFTYDPANGNLKTVVDPEGAHTAPVGDFETVYSYNTFGQLTQVVDANGNPPTVYADYDLNGYPKTITDPLGNATRFQYDTRGQVVSVKDAKLKESVVEYDDFGRVVKQSVPHDAGVVRTTHTQYDLNDNPVLVIAPNGAETKSVFNAADAQESSILPSNGSTGERKVTFSYDDLDRLLEQTAPRGNLTSNPDDFVTRYSYDPVGQLLAKVTPFDGKSSYKTTYVYDRVGNLDRVVDPRKNDTTDSQDFTARMTYDLNHRRVTTTDAAGHTTRTSYDRDGLAIAEYDAEGNKKTTVYDRRGKVAEVSVPHTPAGRATVQRTTKYRYDENGNRIVTESPIGVSTTADATDSITRLKYDANNRVIEQIAPFKTGEDDAHTYFEYDPVGNLARQSDPTYDRSYSLDWTVFSWFDDGLVKTSTDPWGISTAYGYNLLGQQNSRKLTSAAGDTSRTMSWDFWPDGSLKARSDNAPPEGSDEILIDNSDVHNVVFEGSWPKVRSAPDKIGKDHQQNSGDVTGATYFSWKLRIPSAGSYEVFARCIAGVATAASATYSIQHATGTATKAVNQKTCTAAAPWISLGTYTFAEGVDKKVTLTAAPTGTVFADAIKLKGTASTTGAVKDFGYSYDVNGQLTSLADRTAGAAVDNYEIRYDGLGRTDQIRELKTGSPRSVTTYGYDANNNLTSLFADDQVAPETDQYTASSYDVRDLLASVKTGKSPADTSLKTTTYTYTARGERSGVTKPNGNTVAYSYLEDGLLRSQIENKGSALVSSHHLGYDLDGRRLRDTSKVKNADAAEYLNQNATMTYRADGRLASVTKSGTDPGPAESYTYDAAGNILSQQQGSKQTFYWVDRNRLLCGSATETDLCGQAATIHNYDPFGRLDTVTANDRTVERYKYDGFDRKVSHRKYDPATGALKSAQTSVFDPLDRTVSETTTVGTGTPKTVNYAYVGLTDQVVSEEQAVSGTDKSLASYTYGPSGERLSQTKTPATGPTETSYYGLNPHTDVETLTSESGDTRSTYRYTAYGSNDATGFTGKDKPTATGGPEVEPYNPYRFNNKRWDPATAGYDMGFRDYSPGLNRFLTRDMYSGALADMRLGLDPWNTNRYTFAGGNPITGIELDGHYAIDENGDRISQDTPTITPPGPTPTPQPTQTTPTQPTTGGKIARWINGKPLPERATEELVVQPVAETYETCKTAFQNGYTPITGQACNTGLTLTALSLTGGGKILGIGVRTAQGLAATRSEAAAARLFTTPAGSAANVRPLVDEFWKVSNVSRARAGTMVPESFDLSTAGQKFSVHPNATKHMAEYARSTGVTPPMSSFAGSIESAVASGLSPGRNFVQHGPWELGIDTRDNVIYHALYRP